VQMMLKEGNYLPNLLRGIEVAAKNGGADPKIMLHFIKQ
jgi:hypothetical protein